MLPTAGAVTTSDQDILLPVWKLDKAMVAKFLRFGTPKTTSGSTTTSTSSSSSTSSSTSTTTTTTPVTGTTTGAIVDNNEELPGALEPRSL